MNRYDIYDQLRVIYDTRAVLLGLDCANISTIAREREYTAKYTSTNPIKNQVRQHTTGGPKVQVSAVFLLEREGSPRPCKGPGGTITRFNIGPTHTRPEAKQNDQEQGKGSNRNRLTRL